MAPPLLLHTRALVCLGLALALAPLRPCQAVKLFVFGDSMLDVGNSLALAGQKKQPLAGWLPYGMSLPSKKVTGRFSDGMVFPDFLADKLGIPWPPPYLTNVTVNYTSGVNFATAGAGSLLNTTISVGNLPLQFGWFSKHISTNKVTRQELRSAFTVLSSGGNDYFDLIQADPLGFQKKAAAFTLEVVNATAAAFERLYALGLRNFIYLAVGPMGCVPYVKAIPVWGARGCMASANNLARAHNAMIATALDAFRVRRADANVVMINVFQGFYDTATIKKIPMTQGACCGAPGPINGRVQCGKRSGLQYGGACRNPNAFLFWDHIHATQATTSSIFNMAWTGRAGVVQPYSLQALFTRLKIQPKVRTNNVVRWRSSRFGVNRHGHRLRP